jgi:hypothetical protein
MALMAGTHLSFSIAPIKRHHLGGKEPEMGDRDRVSKVVLNGY